MSKITQRILKLQSLAASNPNEHEAEAAAEQALRLMREHAVTQADLDAEAAQREDPLVQSRCYLVGLECQIYEERTGYVAHLARWKRSLFIEIARYLGLRSSWWSGTGIAAFYGHRSDCALGRRLYEICARQIDAQAKEHVRARRAALREASRWDLTAGEAKEAANAFRTSAVLGLADRFSELAKESEATYSDAHALVVNRAQRVSDWVDAQYTFKRSNDGLIDDEAPWSEAGYRAGQTIRLTADKEVEGEEVRQLKG